MARIRGHATLREDKPLFVLREMTINDHTYRKGDPFPWQEIQGLTPRTLRLLWEQRKIAHERPADAAQGAEDPLRSPQEQARAEARDGGRKPPRAKAAGGGVRGLG